MKIRSGIIGCGRIAQRHAQHIINHTEGEVVAVYDKDETICRAFAEKNNVDASDSYEALLSRDDIDIINICTPNGLHYEHSMQALEAGKHVLVEKPMALNTVHCEEMINKALQKNKQLFAVMQNRYNPPIAALKKLVEEKKLGKIYNVVINCYWNRNEDYYQQSSWKGTKDLDGGTLFTQFSHFVDIFYYVFGDIENIQGKTQNANHQDTIEFEDSGFFHFNFKSGGLGSFNYTTSSYEQNMEGSITVFSENATIKVGGQYLNTLEYQKTKGFDITDLPLSGPANDYGTYKGSMSNHDRVIDNVVNVLNNREQIMTNAMEGLKVVNIIERMYESAK